ncbi:unnamed protein product [marine sediment metagenome]|uniref:Peptide deformylase n=1 Tax=marine sediment metagenome TaxID=412755 RepID=X1REV6_9ZZZZ
MEIITDIEKLRKPARLIEPADDFTEFVELADLLLSEMIAHNGQGLAANQLGYDKRIFVMNLNQGIPICIINPMIMKTRGNYESNEACLSLPGVIVRVKRPYEIKVKGVNKYFRSVNYRFRGIESRRACHEIDHLDGKLIIDYKS